MPKKKKSDLQKFKERFKQTKTKEVNKKIILKRNMDSVEIKRNVLTKKWTVLKIDRDFLGASSSFSKPLRNRKKNTFCKGGHI